MSERWLPKGARYRGKQELIAALKEWLATSKEPTIGDTGGAYHGQFWISAHIGGHSVRIAADTTRGAVQRVVDAMAYDTKVPRRIISNQRGPVNKLVIADRAEPGWFAYLTKPLSAEATI